LLEDITYAQGRYKCPAKGAYKHNGYVAHLANGGECFVADSKEKSAHSNQYIGTEDFLPKLFSSGNCRFRMKALSDQLSAVSKK
jgi:hypothetical protein